MKKLELTKEEQVKVEKQLASGKEKYKDFAHIICEKDLPDEYLKKFEEEDFG